MFSKAISDKPFFIVNSLDANAVPDEGMYICSATITNAPTTNHGALWNVKSLGTPYQMFFPDNQTNIYKRWYTSGAWTTWNLIQVPTDINAFRNSIGIKTFSTAIGATAAFSDRNGDLPLIIRKIRVNVGGLTTVTKSFTPFPNAAIFVIRQCFLMGTAYSRYEWVVQSLSNGSITIANTTFNGNSPQSGGTLEYYDLFILGY